MEQTLYVAISAHGYGHVAQTAPVVNELWRRNPKLRVVVECSAPHEVLSQRFEVSFEHVPIATDFGMVMKDALQVDVEASHARYVDLHANLEAHVIASTKRLQEHQADVLLANVPYVPLTAAKRVGIPTVAMCSLNWADIYAPLCNGTPGAAHVYREMARAYRAADCFLAPRPAMPMHILSSTIAIGPIGSIGRPRTSEIRSSIGFERLVLVTMGGIGTRLDFAAWPRIDGVVWAVPDGTHTGRDDMVRHSDAGMPFIDLLASSDALITKPGYGAFVEAAVNGLPILYIPRPHWPEAPYLVQWLGRHGRCLEISNADLESRHLSERLTALWSQAAPGKVVSSGIREAADIIGQALMMAGASRNDFAAGGHA